MIPLVTILLAILLMRPRTRGYGIPTVPHRSIPDRRMTPSSRRIVPEVTGPRRRPDVSAVFKRQLPR